MAEYILTDSDFGVILKLFADATSINIADAGGYFTGTEVETALQEVGQELLQHKMNGFEDRSASTISWDNATRTFTITPNSTDYYWMQGVRYSYDSAKSVQIDDSSGIHWIYFNGATLTAIQDPTHSQEDDLLTEYCLVGAVYWNATDGDTVLLADERHGVVLSPETHHWLHDNIGAKFRDGAALSEYTLNTASDAAISFDITDIEFYDEDIEHVVEDGVATNQYEQVLTGDAEIPVLYRDANGDWTQQAASTLPYLVGGTPNLAYNEDQGGGTWAVTEIGNNNYCTSYLVITNDWEYPLKMVAGNAEYGNVFAAIIGAATEILNWGTLPAAEFVVLYQFILQDGNGGTTDGEIVAINDFRYSQLSGASYQPTDHGTLTGLGDDDHAQYLLADGTRALTGNWAAGSTYYMSIAEVRAASGDGLSLLDDAGNLGVLVLDGGALYTSNQLGIGISPTKYLHVSVSDANQYATYIHNSHATAGYGVYIRASDDKNVNNLQCVNHDASQVLMTLTGAGILNVGATTSNANMTVGLTINQGANDDEILAFKSSDIGHGYTTRTETDTYAFFQKRQSGSGGLQIETIMENAAYDRVLQFYVRGGTATTTKSPAGTGLIDFRVEEHDGANSPADITANGNIISVRARTVGSVWILDVGGDTWQSGAIYIDYGKFVYADDAGGTARSVLGMTGGVSYLSNDTVPTQLRGNPVRTTYSLFINETDNANMSRGITINQGANDDEILAFKSSDVAHGMTTLAETDTYGMFMKASATDGAPMFYGFSTGSYAMVLRAVATTADTTKSSEGVAPLLIDCGLKSGTTWGAMSADGNLVAIRNNATATVWILGEDGGTWQSGGMTTSENVDSAATTDEVKLGAYDLSAGNRCLAISQEAVVAADTDETKFSNKLPVRINGTTYYIMLTTT